ncbi:MAG TPA: APC family permease, partial [Gemmataceae bacterium]|nr:APC family permease [Gemmataceae bacterium]
EFWIIRSASIAALATIFSQSLFNVLREPAVATRLGYAPDSARLSAANEVYVTGAVILGLALVNVRGVRWGGVLQLFITVVKVGSLVGIMALPLLFAAPSTWPELPPDAKHPPASFTIGGFASALLAVLWAYHGWMNGATVAGEVKDPHRNVPISLIGGVAVIIALYLGANFAYAWVIPQEQMANIVDMPVATRFSVSLLGAVGTVILSAVVMCSVFGALNGNILVGPRVLYAMGEDRLVPPAVGRVHPRYHTPAVAILVLSVWSVLLVAGVAVLTRTGVLDPRTDAFDVLTNFAMFGVVIFETMAVLSIFVFRRRYPKAERPYRCWGYPATPILYALLPALILGNMFVNQRLEALSGVAIVALGAAVYVALLRRPGER